MEKIKQVLDAKLKIYQHPDFILTDPVCIPHRFTQKQDIEIAGFFAAIFSWGNRTSIINSATKLIQLMENAPYDFICHHEEQHLKRFLEFKHRTFNATDLLYFIQFLQHHYQQQDSLESAFVTETFYSKEHIGEALIHFHQYFFSLPHPSRTSKHISTPLKNSACKRINMFLRWMVRKDEQGIDFGLWEKIQPHQLICPLDVHVANVAYRLGLLYDATSNWKNAVALTQQLKHWDPDDPIKYDYALFGIGMAERLKI